MTSTTSEDTENGPLAERNSQRAAVGSGAGFAWFLAICGALGLWASFIITNGRYALLQGEVVHKRAYSSWILSPVVGLAAYGVVICLAMGMLAGARYKPWFWCGLQAGGLFGVGLISWLQYQVIYNFQAICEWVVSVLWSGVIMLLILARIWG